jgi:hypothetical protein
MSWAEASSLLHNPDQGPGAGRSRAVLRAEAINIGVESIPAPFMRQAEICIVARGERAHLILTGRTLLPHSGMVRCVVGRAGCCRRRACCQPCGLDGAAGWPGFQARALAGSAAACRAGTAGDTGSALHRGSCVLRRRLDARGARRGCPPGLITSAHDQARGDVPLDRRGD